ncbi:MAG: RluA family pseudouridine synthase, partial [Planctomycetes bacterium]|nr:RluA family pseudouridine synthase [Planctomycetota bacterium]
ASRLPLLHEDDRLVVVLKPAGLSSVPSENDRGKTCWSELRASHPGALPVHRLDRDVSGALLFALDAGTRDALEEQFRQRTVAKTYLAVVNGTPRPAQGTINRPIVDLGQRAEVRVKGQPAVTHYRVVRPLDKGGRASLVEIELETGRYNQIRLHFVAIGHPLIGERKYARGRDHTLRFGRPALHAWKLAFAHPATGERVAVEAPLPEDFARLTAAPA